jgi:TonB family protein
MCDADVAPFPPQIKHKEKTVAVPRFNYELPPRRKDRLAVSIFLHIAVFIFVWQVLPYLPAPEIQQARNEVVPLYVPPPLEQQPPAQMSKPIPPPKLVAVMNAPKIHAPQPEVKVEAPKVEFKPKLDEVVKVTPTVPKAIVTGAFVTPETTKPTENKKEIVQNAFAQGTNTPATLQKSAREVQTGGFGDPNGVRGTSDKKGLLTIASLGGFNLPSGPGNGNGTGGSRGATGTVASAGFGDIAGGGSGNRQRSGTVSQGGFGQVTPVAPVARVRSEEKATLKPVEVLFKPRPVYTDEARHLHVEGEVVVEVTFTATGQLVVRRVVRGLGHGLDESALRAAQQIKYKPALRDGEPYDSTALVHIVFELAE